MLVAKSSLDGHWRGVAVVARALREAGFEVILGGMLRPSEMAAVAAAEDVDLVGINVGGRVEVVERALDEMEAAGVGDIPVFVGGTVPPQAISRLTDRGWECFLREVRFPPSWRRPVVSQTEIPPFRVPSTVGAGNFNFTFSNSTEEIPPKW